MKPLRIGILLGTALVLITSSAVGQANCPSTSASVSNFNGTPIESGRFIWFNANFTASGIPSSGATLTFTNSTIQLGAAGQTVPDHNGQITFSPSGLCVSTTHKTIIKTWRTTYPIWGGDEIFLDGLAFH